MFINILHFITFFQTFAIPPGNFLLRSSTANYETRSMCELQIFTLVKRCYYCIIYIWLLRKIRQTKERREKYIYRPHSGARIHIVYIICVGIQKNMNFVENSRKYNYIMDTNNMTKSILSSKCYYKSKSEKINYKYNKTIHIEYRKKRAFIKHSPKP